MKVIGLIGGMNWNSTLEYYRLINEMVSQRLGGPHSARIVLYSLDFEEIERAQLRESRWDDAASILAKAGTALKQAGTDFLLICTNTMHKVADTVGESAGILVLHIVDATGNAIREQGLAKVGLLGTRFVMEEHFYRDRLKKHFDIDVLVPAEDEQAIVHRIIYDELCRGKIAIPSRQACLEIIEKLTERGAEGIVLGCTELPLLIRPGDTHVSVFDTTSKWNQLRAVENKQVFLRPDNPFSWFDGPPGPCQIVGMYWMVNKLYPDKTTELDLKAKVKEFYSKFFHYDLTDDEIVYLLDTQR